MTPRSSRRRREPQAPEPRSLWGQLLDVLELSGPGTLRVLGFVLGILAVGFGPLLMLAFLDVGGTARRGLIALGPVGICAGLAALTWVCGHRYGEALGWTRRQLWGLVVSFVVLGLLGGLGLWLGADA
jgi:hypothetical protein